jgi:hypothetical protein
MTQTPNKKRKQRASEIVLGELLYCGGEWKSRKEIYEDLIAEGFEPKYVDSYLFYLSNHQPPKEKRMVCGS